VTAALPPLLVVAGATATGKTSLSLRLATALRDEGIAAEIISADSRQVYRGLDIGTAKATAADRTEVRHHGLDLVEPDQPFSVADYLDHVALALAGIGARGGLAILVGGTGFYLRSVVRGLDTAALPADAEIRRQIEAEIGAAGVVAAADRLRTLAPALSARTDLRNPRRVARALEVATIAGDIALPPGRPYRGRVAWLGLRLEPVAHRRAIAERARAQFDAGLVEEAASIRRRFDPALPAFSAIGYREAWAFLDGQLDREAAIALDASRNVTFARRQATWFRAEREIEWRSAEDDPLSLALERARALADGAGIVPS
jgi:tRNA dimethylallyltransferase